MFKIFPYVFFRRYGDDTFVYDNFHHKVYLFNGTAYDILHLLTEGCTFNTLLSAMKEKYVVGDEQDFSSTLYDFLRQLTELNLIDDQHAEPNMLMNNLESEMNLKTIRRRELYSVFFELTYRCNEHCKHCYVCRQKREELTTSQIKTVLDRLYVANVMHLTFSGGEVSMREDFFDILTYAIEKNFVVDIFSNGLNFNASDIEKIAKLYPRSLHCSIYSPIPEKHDSITGVPGSFEKTISVLKQFRQYGIAVNIKTVMMENNCADYTELIRLAKSIGATLQTGMSVMPKQDGGKQPTQLRMHERQLEAILRAEQEIVFQNKKEKPAKRDTKATICGAGLNNLSINPYGDVFPCGAMDIMLGNVKENDIIDLWENSKALKIWQRNTFEDLKECVDCLYMDYCAFCPAEAFLEKGNRFAKYDEACTMAQARFRIYNKIGR